MSGRKSFDALKSRIDADPARRARVDEVKHAMREVMALAELRAKRQVTQRELADALDVTQSNVSRVEHEDDLYLSTLRSYVEALGGELQLRAVFEDGTVDLDVREPEAV
jgi:DNA-binding XRE family transcriptional regulator